jgi:hypothetical protein
MLKALAIIGIVAVVVIAAVLVLAATKPDSFRVERSASIKGPPEKIFGLINDFDNWRSWSPWEKMDPAMQRTYSGPESGKGSVYEWEGNNKVGKGRMEIIDAPPPYKVAIKLDFLKPFEATTPPSSRSRRRATPRTSPGPCTGPVLSSPR